MIGVANNSKRFVVKVLPLSVCFGSLFWWILNLKAVSFWVPDFISGIVPNWLFWLLILYVSSYYAGFFAYKIFFLKDEYFKKVDFGKKDEETVGKAVDGILNTEKTKPFYVHAAPACREAEEMAAALERKNFIFLSGAPGEGKSMAAYHAAHKFFRGKKRRKVYELKTEELASRGEKAVIDEILLQLDFLELDFFGCDKLILVDDAQKIASQQELCKKLRLEADEGNGKFVWVRTELYEEENEEELKEEWFDETFRIDFPDFLNNLVEGFYKSEDPLLRKELEGRMEGLNEAIDRAGKRKIIDAWLFAFYASQREKELPAEINKLGNPEILTLFLISAYTILSGEAEMHSNDIVGKICGLRFGWLDDELRRRNTSVSGVIADLQKKKLIKIYSGGKNDRGYIASLHYKFASKLIGLSFSRSHLEDDLIAAATSLLSDDHRKCVNIGAFIRLVGSCSPEFIRKNKAWMLGFLNQFSIEMLAGHASLLDALKKTDKDFFETAVENLSAEDIARKASGIYPGQFRELFRYLAVLGHKQRDRVAGFMDPVMLADAANNIAEDQIAGLVNFLSMAGSLSQKIAARLNLDKFAAIINLQSLKIGLMFHFFAAIGSRKEELIKKLDFARIAGTINEENLGDFAHLASFLKSLGSQKKEMTGFLDMTRLAEAMNGASAGQICGLSLLAEFLESQGHKIENKLCFDPLIERINESADAHFESVTQLLKTFSRRRNEIVKKMDIGKLLRASENCETGGFQQLTRFIESLGPARQDFLNRMDFNRVAATANSVSIDQFDDLACLLEKIGSRKKELVEKLDLARLAETAGTASIEHFEQLARFIDSLDFSKDEFLNKLDTDPLARAANSASIGQFDQLARLVNAIGERRADMLEKMDFSALAGALKGYSKNRITKVSALLGSMGAEQCGKFLEPVDHDFLIEETNRDIENFHEFEHLTRLMGRLEEPDRMKYIMNLDWKTICLKCPLGIAYLGVLGLCLKNLAMQAEKHPEKSGFAQDVAERLRSKSGCIRKEISAAVPAQYSSVAKFFWGCNLIEPVLAGGIAFPAVYRLADRFTVYPDAYRKTGMLIKSVNNINVDLAIDFIGCRRVYEKIADSINHHDWSQQTEDLKFLAGSIYSCFPDFWRNLVNSKITADLSALDLEAVYRAVDEGKNAVVAETIVS